jgi:hypothetical protein
MVVTPTTTPPSWARFGDAGKWHAYRRTFPGDPMSFCGRDLRQATWGTHASVAAMAAHDAPLCKHCVGGVATSTVTQ